MSKPTREIAERIIEVEALVPFDCPSIKAELAENVDVERLIKRIDHELARARQEGIKDAIEIVHSQPFVAGPDQVEWIAGFTAAVDSIEANLKCALESVQPQPERAKS